MLPILLPYNQSRALAIQRIDAINANQPTRTHVRRVSYLAGEEPVEKEFTTQPKAISLGARAGFLFVVDRARKQVERMRRLEQQMPGLWAQHVTDTGDTVPPITFNCVELAGRLATCEKSIRNYVQQWLATGLVLKKKFHGRKHNVELWINPEYLWKTIEIDVDNAETPIPTDLECTRLDVLIQPIQKNLPPKSFLKPLEALSTITCDVEKLHSDVVLKPSSGNGGLQDGARQAPSAQEGASEAKQTTSGTVGGGGAAAPTSSLQEYERMRFVTELRQLAEKLLYAGKSYSVERTEKTIREGVFNNFVDPLSPEQWAQFHRQCLRRIELMRDFVLRKPDSRFTPAPYSEISPGKGWFDWENEKGFRGTEAWFIANQRHEYQRKITDALNLAERELVDRRKYDRHQNPARMKTTKRVKTLTLMDLYQFHHKRLHRLGGAEALHKLNARVAALLT